VAALDGDFPCASALSEALNDGRFKDIDAARENETKYVFLTKDGLGGGAYNIFFAESADDDTDFSEIRLVGTVDASDGFAANNVGSALFG